jgi:hypothetical protein
MFLLNLGSLEPIFFFKYFPPSGFAITHMLVYLMMSHRSLRLSFLLLSLHWTNRMDWSSSFIILSSASSNLRWVILVKFSLIIYYIFSTLEFPLVEFLALSFFFFFFKFGEPLVSYFHLALGTYLWSLL